MRNSPNTLRANLRASRSSVHFPSSHGSVSARGGLNELDDLSQEQVLERLRDDDEVALDLVLQRFWDPLVSYLARWLGSADTAEDIAQQTFLRLWHRRKQWKPQGGSLRALLFRMARNLAISEQRTRNARARAIVRLTDDPAHRREPTPLQTIENRELGEALERAIGTLPDRRREVFVLRCVHDLSYKEIAGVMGIAEQTVANQLSRALATLRGQLGHLLTEQRKGLM